MRNATLVTVVIATGLGLAVPVANAMPPAPSGQLRAAEGAAEAIKKTVLLCDAWTCYWRPDYGGYDRPDPYRGWRRHYWWGWQRPWWGWDSPWRRW
jgi:hypothetical protein